MTNMPDPKKTNKKIDHQKHRIRKPINGSKQRAVRVDYSLTGDTEKSNGERPPRRPPKKKH